MSTASALQAGGGDGTTIKNFTAWNVYQWGIFPYQCSKLTLDGFTDVGDRSVLSSVSAGVLGGDYLLDNLTIINSDFENLGVGIIMPGATGGTTTIRNCTLIDETGIYFGPMMTVQYYSDWFSPRITVIDNVHFGNPTGLPLTAIAEDFPTADQFALFAIDLIAQDQVTVLNYNGVPGDNFQVYKYQQAASFVIPQSVVNTDGSDRIVGAPVAGLTNQLAWDLYGIAIGGAVAPANATARDGIIGLVGPL
jgi:hypothetical protein